MFARKSNAFAGLSICVSRVLFREAALVHAMRRLHRYCLKRRQVKMSWNGENCFNIARAKPFNDQKYNIFQMQWKCKTLCRLYYNGDVTHTLFRRTYVENKGDMIETLASMERRIDNVLFRSMLAPSIFAARKMASEGQVSVNGQRVQWPDHRLKDGDMLQVSPKVAEKVYALADHPFIRVWAFLPAYLEVSYSTLSAVFLRKPELHEIPSPYPKSVIDHCAGFFSRLI